jgi:hypothetical protein
MSSEKVSQKNKDVASQLNYRSYPALLKHREFGSKPQNNTQQLQHTRNWLANSTREHT